MAYSQKPLIQIMQSGQVFAEIKSPKHIETVISNVFIFDKKVYKFYKNDNDFFNKGFRDISTKKARFAFMQKDFEWNRTLSPSIYLKLIPISVIDGAIQEKSLEEAEELIMFMKRVNTHDVLYEKLVHGDISLEDSFEIGKQLGENLLKVQKPPIRSVNFYIFFEPRIVDLRNWIKSVTDYISEEESGLYCDFLESFRVKHKDWFEGELSEKVTADGDFHSHNALYSEGKLYFMDTYPPKEAWGMGLKFNPVYRMGVDIWALTGRKDFFENFVKGYEAGSGEVLDRKLDDLYIVYASSIMVSYLYMLQRTDLSKKESAIKFHQFLRNYFKTIRV